ncbi:hypothetical protein SAMN04487770_10681 [Butyrivibrio sp. ob235]|uniref:hypothetical protein n=1 Tax=Butyrivibrio sp. ob235 TaxID=1761780 RepID=UPI0008C4C4E8|nr:hypothetical protein [Butyrivibrio sp. ob235]SEL13380.1 hypothetical protein SAMN04487770_10681 [Butyrivibrio sp. ob235]
MSNILFTQVINLILQILIFGEIISLLTKKIRCAGVIAIIISILIFIIGIITPISIVVCTMITLVLSSLGVFAIKRGGKAKEDTI